MQPTVSKPEHNTARKRLLKQAGLVFLLLLGYYLFVRLTGIGIPCVFYQVTGLQCPGCGISRMLLHLLHLEWQAALDANPVLFFMLPFFGVLWLIRLIWMPRWLDRHSKCSNGILWGCIVILLLFGVLRNL